MSDEEWVKVATADDTVVAELLLRLKQVKQPAPPPPPPPPPLSAKPALSLDWTVRQRRSKAVPVQKKKQAPRASPTTPLSWSGATSVSGVGGGGAGSGGSVDGGPEEESSRPYLYPRPPKTSGISRSKVTGTGETTNSKRSRKKKTLAELKEEENLLQKERRQLKRELATLRLNLEKERARNENFKKIKLELLAPPASECGRRVASDSDISDKLPEKMATVDLVPALLPPIPANSCSEVSKELTVDKFVLPDLNIPFEENSSRDVLCGVS